MLVVRNKVKTTLPIIQIKADTIIFEEGWDDYKMFFVVEGSVQLYNEYDDKEVEVAVIKQHEFFGEVEMYSKCPRKNSAKMITNVKLVVIRTPIEFEKFTNDNKWLMGKMMQTMSERLVIANDLLVKKSLSEFTAPSAASPVLEVVQDNTIRRIIRH